MDWEKWHAEAKRAGQHYWVYPDLVDDNEYGAMAAFEAGMDPFAYILEEGKRLDLHEFGTAWGGH